jgi:CheY-like chemotaxis protein
MSKKGPIILIEDDIEDQEITKESINETGITNEVICFTTCDEALTYLMNTMLQPFLILSDVNLPKMSGIDLKRSIDANEYLRKKSIPFIFYSTSADNKTVNSAYEQSVQGYFTKDFNIAEMRNTLTLIFNYWGKCCHPNN